MIHDVYDALTRVNVEGEFVGLVMMWLCKVYSLLWHLLCLGMWYVGVGFRCEL